MNKKINFSDGFLWGAATSAYQCEGALESRGLNVFDSPQVTNEITKYPRATGHFKNWEEDVNLMKKLGLKSYRFSISWARILRNGMGQINEDGLFFYRKLIDSLLANNIEPIITLFHYDTPLELQKLGGWRNRDVIIPAFLEYVKIVFENFGDKVNYWLTLNEQNMMTMVGHVTGIRLLEERHNYKEIYQENHHMFLAQALAIKLFRKMCPNKMIGPAPNISLIYASSSDPKDQIAASNANSIRNWLYLDVPFRGKYNPIALKYLSENGWEPDFKDEDIEILKDAVPDYIGFNYYSTKTVSSPKKAKEEFLNSDDDQETWTGMYNFFDAQNNPFLEKTSFGWGIDPIGLRNTAREIYARYNVPMIITENGIGVKNETLNVKKSVDDNYRIEFIESHISEISKSINEGIPIFGYCLWSFIDLISTHNGISKRYGLVYVDTTGQHGYEMGRYPKKSFYWYQALIKNNKI